jgi:hypothetical protein
MELAMSFILALIQTVNDFFVSPHLPLDSDYSYQARRSEAERVRRSQIMLVGLMRH